ncbi:hypothetical protein AMTRI_Chr13g88330 [Amborella trichopoda]
MNNFHQGERSLARYVGGQKSSIQDMVVLQQYWTLKEAYNLAVKVEAQLRHTSSRWAASRGSSSGRGSEFKETGGNLVGGQSSRPASPSKQQETVCNLIIDGGSCENIVSQEMLDKLKLKKESHPKPYKITWFKRGNKLPEGLPPMRDIQHHIALVLPTE